MEEVLIATERSNLKRSDIRSLREDGHIPAVIYGKKVDNLPISIQKADFIKQIREVGRNGILSIDIDGKKQQAVLRSYEKDPLTWDILHIDFLAVDSSTEITTEVRVVLTGEAFGVKDGGVLQQALHNLSITANANELPDAIEVDVTKLKVGETISVGDIKGQHSFEINHENDEVIASILPPKQEEEISTGEEQQPGIPENLEGREE